MKTADLIAAERGETNGDWRANVPVDNSRVARFGIVAVFGAMALFGAWAAFVPLSAAVVTSGELVAVGANQLVQHRHGGVVRRIMVSDGDVVAQGDVLVRLEDGESRARLMGLLAREATLKAKRARLTGTEFSGVLRGSQESPAANALRVQQALEGEAADARRAAAQVAAQAEIDALRDEEIGFADRIAGEQALLAGAEADVDRLRPLVAEGFVARNRLRDAERERLTRATGLAELRSQAASLRQRIGRAMARMNEGIAGENETTSKELTAVLGELAEIEDEIAAARTAMTGSDLRAPVAGVVKSLAANTAGGVVAAGATVAEIVPAGGRLEARFSVAPQDVRAVKVGHTARIVATAYNRRTVAPIEGEVRYVSADTTVGEDGRTPPYYEARAALGTDVPDNLRAGMTVEVYVLGESRTFLDYVLRPITESFSGAFNETN